MSNKHRGDAFARLVGEYLSRNGYHVEPEYPTSVGLGARKKKHRFDFGNEKILIECKAYDWTAGSNNPSAKIATLNEAMMYFHSAPPDYKKMVFVSATGKKGVRTSETFAEYYARLHGHFIPDDVELWEFNTETLNARRIAL
ncbi:restriction endonuclease [Methylobacter marinus]|uniref:restriction endonuclease n=1 Tax=Methylobacter marinus TaxID=34058 RepID=UPI00037C0FAC|nr:restriction endonuclease [Methylobacter marinus]